MDTATVSEGLEQYSGIAGVGRRSGDMRAVLEPRQRDDDAVLAYDVYVDCLRREIARMTAAIGGIDGLVFTGGVGEHSPDVGADAVAGLTQL